MNSNRSGRRCALVTGGSRGLGRAIVQALAVSFDTVAFTYRSRSDLAHETQKLSMDDRGQNCILPLCWNFDDDQWEVECRQFLEDYGPVDVLVNNAGVTIDTLALTITPRHWDAIQRVNLRTPLTLMTLVGRDMVYHRRGNIINMASAAIFRSAQGQALYTATKSALVSVTRSYARELGRSGVRVNAVAPGFVETELWSKVPDAIRRGFKQDIPLRRWGKPEEIANVVAFLASPQASYINGAIIVVDGGLTS